MFGKKNKTIAWHMERGHANDTWISQMKDFIV